MAECQRRRFPIAARLLAPGRAVSQKLCEAQNEFSTTLDTGSYRL